MSTQMFLDLLIVVRVCMYDVRAPSVILMCVFMNDVQIVRCETCSCMFVCFK